MIRRIPRRIRASVRHREREQLAARRYLVGAAVGAWFTKQALRPVPMPKLRAIPSFFAGWLTNELAFHHVVWQGIATGMWARQGALRHWQGKAALGLTLAQWVGLGVVIRDVFATKDALEQALRETLGEDDSLDEEPAIQHRDLRWGQLVAPFPMRAPEVERIRGVSFCRAGDRDLHLDVYRSLRGSGGPRPVILFIHGGAWMISNRNEQGIPLMHEMAARGWIGVNADYRLSPAATFPDHLVDVKRAIAWIRANADDIGADPGFIAISGSSAGGHLCALAALTPNDPRYQPGFADDDTSVQACIPFYGVYDLLHRETPHQERFIDFMARFVMKAKPEEDPEGYRAASPIEQVDADAPPFMVIQGAKDTVTPKEGARAFVDALRAATQERVVYAELPGAQHAFEVFPSLRTAYALHAVARFLDAVHDQHQRRAAHPEMRDGAGLTYQHTP